MSDHTRRVKTQWNSYVRPFDSFSDEEISGLLGFCSETTRVAEKFSGKPCFLAYGALLGLERSGKLIPHDFDIDVAIHCGVSSKDDVAELCRKLMLSFIEAGYEVKAKCFAQFFVLPPEDCKDRYKVEFFASWIEEDKFFLYFALPGVDIVDSLFPLKEVELEGHTFFAPKNPGALLSATYGDDWAVPNPDFKYDMSGGKWAPFTSYFFSRNKKQWDNHYSMDTGPDTENVGSYDFQSLLLEHTDHHISRIVDVGCGLGHVAMDFARKGYDVTAVDTSEVAIGRLENAIVKDNLSSLKAQVINLYDIPECEQFAIENKGSIDRVIAKNLLNYISAVGESTFFRMASTVLSDVGELHVIIPSAALVSAGEDCSATEPNKRLGIEFYSRTVGRDQLTECAENCGLMLATSNPVERGADQHLVFKLDDSSTEAGNNREMAA